MNDYDRTLLEGLHHDMQEMERQRMSIKWKQAEIDDRIYREQHKNDTPVSWKDLYLALFKKKNNKKNRKGGK